MNQLHFIACISRVSSQNSPIFKAVTNIFEPDFICRRSDDALLAAWMIDFLHWPFNICYSLLCHRPLFLIKFGRPISSTICKLGSYCDTIRSWSSEIQFVPYQVIVIRDFKFVSSVFTSLFGWKLSFIMAMCGYLHVLAKYLKSQTVSFLRGFRVPNL